MSDDEVVNASMQRVNADTEKLTRRNMKECVAEFIHDQVLEDIAFARLTMHPRKVNDPLFPVHQRQGVGLHSG